MIQSKRAIAAIAAVCLGVTACSASKTSATTPSAITPSTTTPSATTPSTTTSTTATTAAPHPTTITPAQAPPTTIAPSVEEALGDFLTSYGAGTTTQTSGVVAAAQGPLAFVAFQAPGASDAMVDVLSYATGKWVRVARLGSSNVDSDQYLEPLLAQATIPTVSAVRLTASAVPDALILLTGGSLGDFIDGIVVSDVGGSWHLVPFLDAKGAPGPSLEVADPRVSGSTVVEHINPCLPDCASDAAVVTTTYTYDAATDEFAPNAT